jgi:hypothetical protein
MAMSRRQKMLLFAPFGLLALALFITIGGQLVRALWNWLLPPIFGIAEITFWQALGILVLCRILFGGLGVRGSGSHSRSAVASAVYERAFRRMDASWDQMSGEERDRFRQRMRERFGFERSGGDRREP